MMWRPLRPLLWSWVECVCVSFCVFCRFIAITMNIWPVLLFTLKWECARQVLQFLVFTHLRILIPSHTFWFWLSHLTTFIMVIINSAHFSFLLRWVSTIVILADRWQVWKKVKPQTYGTLKTLAAAAHWAQVVARHLKTGAAGAFLVYRLACIELIW